MLNQEYWKNPEWAFEVSGRPTFWSRCSSFFMYFDGARGVWSVAASAHWIQIRLGRARRRAYSIAFQFEPGTHDFETGWHELASDKDTFVWNAAARSQRGPSFVPAIGNWREACSIDKDSLVGVWDFFDSPVKAQRLLATIPGALAAARAFSRQPLTQPLPFNDEFQSFTVKDFLCVCTILNDLPADDGRLASSLQQENLSGFDAVFMGLCMEAAQKAKRQTQEPQERERRQELTRPLRKTSLPIPSHPFPSVFPWFLHVSFSFDKLLNLLLCSLRLKDSPEGPAKMFLPVRHQGAHSWKRQLLPPFWVVPYCLRTKMESS